MTLSGAPTVYNTDIALAKMLTKEKCTLVKLLLQYTWYIEMVYRGLKSPLSPSVAALSHQVKTHGPHLAVISGASHVLSWHETYNNIMIIIQVYTEWNLQSLHKLRIRSSKLH